MNIVVGSAFRNSTGYLKRYFAQLDALHAHVGPKHFITLNAVEGDSTDDTTNQLMREAEKRSYLETVFTRHEHGGPWFGSTEEHARMVAMTGVGNAILQGVGSDEDVLVYIESDLIWDPHTIGSLVDIAYERRDGADIVAPLIFAGEHFYDVFCYRKNGDRFSPFHPYHRDLNLNGLTEVDSVGSCLVMRAEIARQIRMPPAGVLLGFCAEARKAGYRVFVDSRFSIRHPA
jgi:hypothetical protein